MKQGFTDFSTVLSATKQYSDLSLQGYLQELSPSQATEFVSSNLNKVLIEANDEKMNAFKQSSTTLKNLDSSVMSGMYLLKRSTDMKNLATDVDTITSKKLDSIDNDSPLRQYEINEWEHSNKLETLYFLQVMLISLSFVTLLLFLKMNDAISQSLFKTLTMVISFIVILILLFRLRYTQVVRDGRYWDKARFPKQPDTIFAPSSASCPSLPA